MGRLHAKKFFITLNEASINYEFIKEIYKRALNVYKSDQSKRTYDNVYIFNLSKQKFIEVMHNRVNTFFNKYMTLRNDILQNTQGQGFAEKMQTF